MTKTLDPIPTKKINPTTASLKISDLFFFYKKNTSLAKL